MLLAPLLCEAALIDRGQGLIYDSTQDITWLQDWNYSRYTSSDPAGRFNWEDANRWAADLQYAGFSDWRLPSALSPNNALCLEEGCLESEFGHLWHVDLGNVAGSALINVGPFERMWMGTVHWTGTVFELAPDTAIAFGISRGQQSTVSMSPLLFAVAVRDGDVRALPAPSTLLLVAGGLLVSLFASKRSRRELGTRMTDSER